MPLLVVATATAAAAAAVLLLCCCCCCFVCCCCCSVCLCCRRRHHSCKARPFCFLNYLPMLLLRIVVKAQGGGGALCRRPCGCSSHARMGGERRRPARATGPRCRGGHQVFACPINRRLRLCARVGTQHLFVVVRRRSCVVSGAWVVAVEVSVGASTAAAAAAADVAAATVAVLSLLLQRRSRY